MVGLGKRTRVTVYALGVLLLLLVCASMWTGYALRHISLSQADQQSITTFFKGALARALVVRKAPEGSPVQPVPEQDGLLNAYQRDPESFRKDTKLFDDWTASAKLGTAALKNTVRGNWVASSADAGYVDPQERLDPWLHAFCLLRRDDELLVMSGGPQARSSPTCRSIDLNAEDLAGLPHGRLLESPAGYFLLVLSRSGVRAE